MPNIINTEDFKKKKNRRKKILIFLILGLAVLGVVLYLLYSGTISNVVNNIKSTTGKKLTSSSSQSVSSDAKNKISNIENQPSDSSNSAAAVKSLDSYINSSENLADKYAYLVQKITVLMNSGDKKGAMNTAIEAYNLYPTSSDAAATVARIAYQLNDKTNAVKYYTLAYNLVDNDSEASQDDKGRYKTKLELAEKL